MQPGPHQGEARTGSQRPPGKILPPVVVGYCFSGVCDRVNCPGGQYHHLLQILSCCLVKKRGKMIE